jgi:hypothetical protein
MNMGYRTLLAVGLAALIASAPVSAQPASKDIKKLEAEIATLREQLSVIQSLLKKAPSSPEAKDESRFGKKDFKGEGKKDFKFEAMKDFFKELGKKEFGPKDFPGQKGPQGEAKKGFGPPMGGFGRPGGFPGIGGFGPPGFGKGGFGGGFVPPGLAKDRFGKGGDQKPGSAEWHEMMARKHMEAARELRKAALEARKRSTSTSTSGTSSSGGGRGTGSKSGGSNIEQRLDQLQRAIEEIRRELRPGGAPQPGLKKVGPRGE